MDKSNGTLRYFERPAREAAEKVLAETFAGRVCLGPEQPLWAGPDIKRNVRRCAVLSGPPACPASVVVKRMAGAEEYQPDDVRPTGGDYGLPTVAWRLLTEWSATRLLQELGGDSPPAPCCWGGSRSEGILVLEDLGPGVAVTELLMGDDAAAAREGLLGYAAALGSVHSLTASREPAYEKVWHGFGVSAGKPRELEADLRWADFRRLREWATALGLAAPSGLDRELAGILERLRDPGPFLALAHGENHPVNSHVAGSTARLLDFEYAMFRHAVLDGAFTHHLFPWVRHRLPNCVRREFEETYRRHLEAGCPEAGDDLLFGRASVETRAAWTAGTLAWCLDRGAAEHDAPRGEDENDGSGPTLRQHALLLLQSLAEDASGGGCLPAVSGLCERLGKRLLALWRPRDFHLPFYPAFAGRKE